MEECDIKKEDLHRVIRLTNWVFKREVKTRGRKKLKESEKEYLKVSAKRIVVTGSDRVKISKNPMYKRRAYKALFGKDKYIKELEKAELILVKIEFVSIHGLSFAPEHIK